MAQDESLKTEEPTPKRLRDARQEGQVALSREVNNWMLLTAATLIVAALGGTIAFGIAQRLAQLMAGAGTIIFEEVELGALFKPLLYSLGLLLLLPAALLAIVAALSAFVQIGPLFAPKRLQPKIEKISPIAGMKRLFSAETLVEFLKGILKLTLVGGVGAAILVLQLDNIERFMTHDIEALLPQTRDVFLGMMTAILAVLFVLMVLDFAFQRARHRKRLRMTRKELMDEFKEIEGDPQIRARIRRIRTERARQRIAQAVPSADVVITNPTHYAVALSYDPDSMDTPRVVAKGIDFLAEEIMRLARNNSVPLITNAPLARTLYAACDVGEDILAEHYQAVAEVITYVWRLKGHKNFQAAAQG